MASFRRIYPLLHCLLSHSLYLVEQNGVQALSQGKGRVAGCLREGVCARRGCVYADNETTNRKRGPQMRNGRLRLKVSKNIPAALAPPKTSNSPDDDRPQNKTKNKSVAQERVHVCMCNGDGLHSLQAAHRAFNGGDFLGSVAGRAYTLCAATLRNGDWFW